MAKRKNVHLENHSPQEKEEYQKFYDKMREKGKFVCVQFHSGKWNGVSRADFEQLGISTKNKETKYIKALKKRISLPNNILFPKDKLSEISSPINTVLSALKKITTNLPVFGKLVEREKYDEWKKLYEEQKTEMNERIDRLLMNMDKYLPEVREDFGETCTEAFCEINKKKRSSLTEEDLRIINEEVEKIMDLIPKSENFRRKFYMSQRWIFPPEIKESDYKTDEEIQVYEELLRDIYTNISVNPYQIRLEALERVYESMDKDNKLPIGGSKTLKSVFIQLDNLNFGKDKVISDFVKEGKSALESSVLFGLDDTEDEETGDVEFGLKTIIKNFIEVSKTKINTFGSILTRSTQNLEIDV